MKRATTSERLKQLMEERGLKQIDIVKLAQPWCKEFNVKMNRSDISQYVTGKVVPQSDKIYLLAKALNVNEAWLMGSNVPMERNLNSKRLKQNEPSEIEYNVTEFEYGLIQKFRMLDARGKKTVLTTLNNEYEYARQANVEELAARGNDAPDSVKERVSDMLGRKCR